MVRILTIALAAATINLIPLLMVDPGGDIFSHYALIDCFASQLWQGDLYPRWCMEANAGLGSPAFLFYYPLAYYITSLFYPLHYLGVGVEGLLLLSFWLAGVAGFLTCRLWLRDVVSPGRAELCAVAYLFMPYRMKLILSGPAMAELWCMSLLPLLFLFTRRLTRGNRAAWLPLTAVTSLSLFTHVSATFFGLLACGLEVLLSTGRRLAPKLAFAGCGLVAIAATAIYWLPAMHFRAYLNPEALEQLRIVPANRYMTAQDIFSHGYAVAVVVMLLLAISMGMQAIRHKNRLPDFVRRETVLWLMIAVVGFVLATFLSSPLWDRFDYVTMGILPWRAQSLVMFGAVYLLAVKMQWFTTEKQHATWKGDYALLLVILTLVVLPSIKIRVPMEHDFYTRLKEAHIVIAREYRTRWTEAELFSINYLFKLSEDKRESKQPEHEAGGCGVGSWDYRGIVLSCNQNKAGDIRIGHFYFPIWQAQVDGKDAPGLHAEDHSGFMLLPVPAGKHEIRLTPDMGASYTWAKLCSLAAWAAMALLALYHKLFRR